MQNHEIIPTCCSVEVAGLELSSTHKVNVVFQLVQQGDDHFTPEGAALVEGLLVSQAASREKGEAQIWWAKGSDTTASQYMSITGSVSEFEVYTPRDMHPGEDDDWYLCVNILAKEQFAGEDVFRVLCRGRAQVVMDEEGGVGEIIPDLEAVTEECALDHSLMCACD